MPTIIDISRVSGLSKSTVSRVLNNHPHVSDESRQKVQNAIKQLGYVRNTQGVQLRLQASNHIGVLVPDVEHPFFSQLVSALSRVLGSAGYQLVIYQTERSREYERDVYARLLRREMDAVVIAHSHFSEREIKEYIGSSIGIVCNEAMDGEFLDVFRLDEEDAVFQATAYLLSKGRRHILFCMDHMTPLQERRWKGFQRAHQQFGLACTKSQCYTGLVTMEDGYALGERLFTSDHLPDGMITGSDFVATGLLKAAKHKGISVPQDLSVIGCDNHPVGLMTDPELTTITNCISDMVRDVTECLTRRLKGIQTAPILKTYKASLIIRKST
ncbi:LacI family DNA-binding transcriptional regulator [Paenibacillus ihbetae]|uniref:Transcriptional regulator n=1 Tax=Paenibacillus ihbetae TaxID=1870820 RepID=A0A1B2E8I9_9BACL|nr:LacI family DNA-binding transcriptional regulator [Paenibacillus ihbetae]ANY76269.1 transcriptional regulator [Paenibacillus ihbetae]OOC61588.1 LacI family transcriptional regulator [Paenibacillus ihbetae]